MRLFTYSSSGNGYKIDLALALLGRHCERVEVAIFQGEGQTPAFLARNASGRIPVLELDDGTNLPESNAILWYLTQGTWLCPSDAVTQARILGWMFFEQNEIEPVLGSARFWRLTGRDRDRRDELERRIAQSRRSLKILDRHLATQRALVGDHDNRRSRRVCVHAPGSRCWHRPHQLPAGCQLVRADRGAAGIHPWTGAVHTRRNGRWLNTGHAGASPSMTRQPALTDRPDQSSERR